MSLYKYVVSSEVEAKGGSDRLSEHQLSATVNKSELLKITDKHRPDGTWAFWYPEAEMEQTELETGQEVRLKTRGNSPFIFSLAEVDGHTVTKCNFAGDEKAGASWTEKILANKTERASSQMPGGEGEGAEEDEWVRTGGHLPNLTQDEILGLIKPTLLVVIAVQE
ncbi:arpin [Notothenia coriiceps]|uniref:Arpin n=1 Tax=Notothenia coriiceps TaxID=8208 RepID=A0A6I9P999_9TELE|nr:PREDICTED: arpin [Notothenia coriiceps]